MEKNIDLVVSAHCILKAYTDVLKRIGDRYGLTMIEIKTLNFLDYYPRLNTVGDIAEGLLLSKGNVSQAVEKLIRMGYMERKPDTKYRRRVYLYLLPAGSPLTRTVREEWERFRGELLSDFTEEDMENYGTIKDKLMRNARSIIEKEGRGKSERMALVLLQAGEKYSPKNG